MLAMVNRTREVCASPLRKHTVCSKMTTGRVGVCLADSAEARTFGADAELSPAECLGITGVERQPCLGIAGVVAMAAAECLEIAGVVAVAAAAVAVAVVAGAVSSCRSCSSDASVTQSSAVWPGAPMSTEGVTELQWLPCTPVR